VVKIRKRKVSFDIEVDEFEKINNYCEINNYKKSDFFREAAIKYFKEKSQFKELYYFDNNNNKFINLLINVEFFDIESFEADELTKKNLGIKKIVKVKLKDDKFLDKIQDNKLLEILKGDREIKCFEK